MSLYEQMIRDIDAKINEAGRHVVIVPAQNAAAPLDTVDIFDGGTHQFIAHAIPQSSAQEFAVIWNNLVDNGETAGHDQNNLMAWITGETIPARARR